MSQFPPRRILVAYDFTEPAQAAWGEAERLARAFGAQAEIVYVEETWPEAEFKGRGLSREARLEITRHVRRKLGADVTVHVGEGAPAPYILKVSRRLRPQLIVMGTHGRTGWSRVWLGSVAESVLRHAEVPVWVTKAPSGPARSILAPVNFTPYAEEAFFYAARTAEALGARLTALHIAAEGDDLEAARLKLLGLIAALPPGRQDALRVHPALTTGPVVESILREAESHDLLVMAAHPRGAVDMVAGTTAAQVMRRAPRPLLAVPVSRRGAAVSLQQERA